MTGKEYMAAVALLPCCVCDKFGMQQTSRTQVHHCFHGRFSSKKASDFDTIPLCEGHHQGMIDVSKLAIHREKKTWLEHYGPDTGYIEQTTRKALL